MANLQVGAMNLQDALHYLDTTSRVSCPQITCEQAAELAALLRAQKQALEHERNERDSLHQTLVGHFVELTQSHEKVGVDCFFFQQKACGFAWDAGADMAMLKHLVDALRKQNDELEQALEYERNERDDLDERHQRLVEDYDSLEGSIEESEGQSACGFAWDAGREIAERDAAIWAIHVANFKRYGAHPGSDKHGAPRLEATGDIDPGVYEGTGKGFEK